MPLLPTIVTNTKNLLIYAEAKISKRIRKLIPKSLTKNDSKVAPKEGVVGIEPAVQAAESTPAAASPAIASPAPAALPVASPAASTPTPAVTDLSQKPAELN